MNLVTIYQLSRQTKRSVRALRACFTKYGFKRVKIANVTREALFDLDEYYKLMEQIKESKK